MTPEVGKAYRGRDGIVRWVMGRSVRGYYSLLWLNEDDGVWYNGGVVKLDRWQEGGCADGGEAPAPQVGEWYKRAGPTGIVSERKVVEFVLR